MLVFGGPPGTISFRAPYARAFWWFLRQVLKNCVECHVLYHEQNSVVFCSQEESFCDLFFRYLANIKSTALR